MSTTSNDWRPIHTAPKMETVLVAGGDAIYPVTACWDGGFAEGEGWQIDGQEDTHCEIGWPTHWMPLPAFPPAVAPDQPDLEHAAKSLASMLTEYVEGGINSNQNWRNGLDEIILARLRRLNVAPVQQSAASSATDLLAWLRDETSLELSFERWEEDGRWQVHEIRGGRNDQEWSLLGRGDTPEQALSAAKIALEVRKDAKAAARARNDRDSGVTRS